MLFDRIDVRRVRHDVAAASAECRARKRELRVTWTRPMADEQRAMARLARRVTELCVLLARVHGRWHVKPPPALQQAEGAAWEAYNTRIAERVALDYPARAGETAAAPVAEGP